MTVLILVLILGIAPLCTGDTAAACHPEKCDQCMLDFDDKYLDFIDEFDVFGSNDAFVTLCRNFHVLTQCVESALQGCSRHSRVNWNIVLATGEYVCKHIETVPGYNTSNSCVEMNKCLNGMNSELLKFKLSAVKLSIMESFADFVDVFQHLCRELETAVSCLEQVSKECKDTNGIDVLQAAVKVMCFYYEPIVVALFKQLDI